MSHRRLFFRKKKAIPPKPIPVSGYVEDGLLFWLDGIHNSATGHNDTVTTWHDISGNNRHCLLSNFSDPSSQWLDDGLLFNGSNQFGTIQNFTQDKFGAAFTFRAVFVSDTTANYRGLAGQHGTGTTGQGICFGQWDSGNLIVNSVGSSGSPRAQASLSGTTAVPLGGRYCVDFVYRGNQSGEVYVNGVKYHILTVSGTIPATLAEMEMWIGRAFNSTDRYWLGQIHSVMGYNRALGTTEIGQNVSRDRERYDVGARVVTPNMTSNTTPAPVALTASSCGDVASNSPWQAFNKSGKMWSGGSTELYDANGYRENGSWIAVDLGSRKLVSSLRLRARPSEAQYLYCSPKEITFEGSDDGITYQTRFTITAKPQPTYCDQVILDEKLPEPLFLRYYRITVNRIWGPNTNCSIGEIELYGPPLLSQPMTSDTTPMGQIASASSAWPSHYAATAFTQAQGTSNETACWASANNSFTAPNYLGNQWLQINLGTKKTISSYIIRHRGYGQTLQPEQFPVDIQLAVSDNGIDFTVADTQTALPAPGVFYQPYLFALSTPAAGSYVRLIITKGRSALVSIGEFELYGF